MFHNTPTAYNRPHILLIGAVQSFLLRYLRSFELDRLRFHLGNYMDSDMEEHWDYNRKRYCLYRSQEYILPIESSL